MTHDTKAFLCAALKKYLTRHSAVVSITDYCKFFYQCCGAVTFWYGSGSSDPYLGLTDPDADPGGPKTYGSGSGILVHLHHSSKKKSHKEVTKQKKSRFFLLFLLDDLEGSGTGAGSIRVTNGSGCGWAGPKNIRIRIRNTDFYQLFRKSTIFYGFLMDTIVWSETLF